MSILTMGDVAVARAAVLAQTGNLPNTMLIGDGALRAMGYDPADFPEDEPGCGWRRIESAPQEARDTKGEL